MFLIGSMSSVFAAVPFGFAKIKQEKIQEGIHPKRQIVGTGVTTSEPPVTSDQPPTTSDVLPTTSDIPASSQPPVTSDAPLTSPSSTTTTPLNTSPTSSSAQTTSSSNEVDLGSTTINRSSLTTPTVVSSPLVASRTERSTLTSVFESNGQSFTSLISTDRVVTTTTGYSASTITPSLAQDSGSSSGLSQTSKNIIGGVVGGVGGAILIGGLAIVVWRLWNRRKQRQAALQNDMWDPVQDMHHEIKPEAEPTLPQYHNPGGSINTASNF